MTISEADPAGALFATVVANGFCIGCGACAAFDPTIRLAFDEVGRYVATRVTENAEASPSAARVCPFADGVPNEDELAKGIFGASVELEPHLGFHLSTYAGWVVDEDYRKVGSSGGMASWLLAELLDRGLIDRVVHVVPENAEGAPLFRFAISTRSDQVRAGAKSRYYPVEMASVLREMLRTPGRYAVVGIPCFIKAVRLACRESELLRERVAYTVGIVCGHLKSTAFAELLGWQCGVLPGELRGIDFRTKLADRSASSYAVTVSGAVGGRLTEITTPTSELIGSNWGHGLFKYKACDFCDDVIGETADISIGDAWLAEYESDPKGTNVVVVRNPELQALISDAIAANRLHLDVISAERVIASQAGAFRHRREGLALRLALEDRADNWRPKKRVEPLIDHLTSKKQEIYSLRYELARVSHSAFAAAKASGDLNVFTAAIRDLSERHDRHYRRTLLSRVVGKISRTIGAAFRKLPSKDS